jgi:hypothetical protein
LRQSARVHDLLAPRHSPEHQEVTMKPLRRMAAAFAVAATLGVGLTAATPATASTPARPMVVATVTIGDVCHALADTIAFLESRPPSRLRDFLLARAEQLFARYCE